MAVTYGTRSEAIDDEIARLLKKSGMTTWLMLKSPGSEETKKIYKEKNENRKLI